MSKDPEKITSRNVKMKRKIWAQLEYLFMKEGYDDLGKFLEDKIMQGVF